MAKSKIEWTQESWNPTTGCTKINSGCSHCYAEIMSKRLKAMGVEKYKHGFDRVLTHPKTLSAPYGWKKNRLVFVNSMSDLFHEKVQQEICCHTRRSKESGQPEHLRRG